MCGLTGVFRFRSAPPDAALVERMRDTLVHRGPDDGGLFVRDGCAFGFRRLSIIDLAGGHQPLFNEDGTLAVMLNGEIYGYRELRRELLARGHALATSSDTETIVHLYEDLGLDFVTRLRGMFAIALYDARRRRLVLVRDRLGIKPLYVRRSADGIAFGSELKALLADPATPRALDPTALLDFLTLRAVPAPKTILRGVGKLRPGQMLVAEEDGRVEVRTYWRPSVADPLDDPPGAIAEELAARLDEAVELRMIADVPLGAFLSGGLDSSAVVESMARRSRLPVVTCSVGFDDRDHDEREAARLVARAFRTDHREHVAFADPKLVLDLLPTHFDEPFSDSSALPTYLVSRLARERVTVALSGDGGDESFAGYRRYRFDALENRVRERVPAPVREPVARALAGLAPSGPRVPRWMRAGALLSNLALDPARAYFRSVSATHVETARAALSPEMRRACAGYDPFDAWKDVYDEAESDDPLARAMHVDLRTYLADDILTKVDRASMAVSLEARVPILDHRLIEWTCRIPPSLKLRAGQGKWIFRRALEPRLPPEILRGRKHGFSVPLSRWMREDLAAPLADAVASGAGGLLDPAYLAAARDAHAARRAEHAELLYAALVLDRWRRRWN